MKRREGGNMVKRLKRVKGDEGEEGEEDEDVASGLTVPSCHAMPCHAMAPRTFHLAKHVVPPPKK